MNSQEDSGKGPPKEFKAVKKKGQNRDQVHSCCLALGARISHLRSKSKDDFRKFAHHAAEKVNESSPGSKKQKTMKRKYLSLAIAALLAAGGLWLARSAWRAHTFHQSSLGVGWKTPPSLPKPDQRLNSPARLAPPDPSRRFTDFTPEQRVQQARQGHGPGG